KIYINDTLQRLVIKVMSDLMVDKVIKDYRALRDKQEVQANLVEMDLRDLKAHLVQMDYLDNEESMDHKDLLEEMLAQQNQDHLE
ncbi:hypothetical protein, partial [Salmonella sp. s51228]|uniref:hypothetical protein n=1 Tax=Salmonella sp. s51228 TaxID=3159652 RepID=UPI003980A4A1